MDLDVHREFQFRGTFQGFPQDLFLDFQLMFVVDVLIVAAAAWPEIWAFRFDPMSGCFDYSLESSAHEPRFTLNDRCFDFFFRQSERKKNRLASAVRVGRQVGKAVAAIDQLFDGEQQEPILNEKSQCSPRRGARSPRPLEVMTAKVSRNIDNLSNEEQTWHSLRFHGLGG